MRKIVHHGIGVNTVAFNQPLPFRPIDSGLGRSCHASICLTITSTQPDLASPCSRSNHSAHLEAMEALGECFAIRSSLLIAQHTDVAAKRRRHVPLRVS